MGPVTLAFMTEISAYQRSKVMKKKRPCSCSLFVSNLNGDNNKNVSKKCKDTVDVSEIPFPNHCLDVL